jgi:cystathionine beta-lyase
MPIYDFDRLPERRADSSAKWSMYPADVLPMFVADMDFTSPEPVIQALADYVGRGVFGYPNFHDHMSDSPALREVLVERLARRYGWRVSPEALVFIPGVVTAFNLAAHTLAAPGGVVVLPTPAYPPMLETAGHSGLTQRNAPLARDAAGRYSLDLDAFEAAFSPATRLMLLCNPHNPTGRVFTRAELEAMAEVCLRRGVTICADEIHAELVYPGHAHLPIASLAPEIEQRTITLIAPSKTFNLPGLQCSIAIIPNAELRAAYVQARRGLTPWVNAAGLIAAEAAYRDGDEWLAQLLVYLQANRDFVAEYARAEMPGVRLVPPEATYLAWLDCAGTGLSNPCQCFLDLARVACNDGATFGPGGEGYVRLNFGCPRTMLAEALARMKAALPG